MKNILILGHNGFVGKNILKYFEEREDDEFNVSTLDRDEYDLTKEIELDEDYDYIICCAAKVGGIKANMNNQYQFLLDNLKIQNNVIEYARYHSKKCIFLGSSCIYPKDYKQPLKEEYLLADKLEPTNEGYALAKIAGLKLCEYLNNDENCQCEFISLMPCNLYGEGERFDENSHVMSALVKRFCDAVDDNLDSVEIWGSGKQRREFLYIDDLVDVVERIVEEDITFDESFLNVGSGVDISIKELSTLIAFVTGFDGEIKFDTTKPDGMQQKLLDVSKIRKKMNWTHSIKLLQGIRKTVDYYKNIKNKKEEIISPIYDINSTDDMCAEIRKVMENFIGNANTEEVRKEIEKQFFPIFEHIAEKYGVVVDDIKLDKRGEFIGNQHPLYISPETYLVNLKNKIDEYNELTTFSPTMFLSGCVNDDVNNVVENMKEEDKKCDHTHDCTYCTESFNVTRFCEKGKRVISFDQCVNMPCKYFNCMICG